MILLANIFLLCFTGTTVAGQSKDGLDKLVVDVSPAVKIGSGRLRYTRGGTAFVN